MFHTRSINCHTRSLNCHIRGLNCHIRGLNCHIRGLNCHTRLDRVSICLHQRLPKPATSVNPHGCPIKSGMTEIFFRL